MDQKLIDYFAQSITGLCKIKAEEIIEVKLCCGFAQIKSKTIVKKDCKY